MGLQPLSSNWAASVTCIMCLSGCQHLERRRGQPWNPRQPFGWETATGRKCLTVQTDPWLWPGYTRKAGVMCMYFTQNAKRSGFLSAKHVGYMSNYNTLKLKKLPFLTIVAKCVSYGNCVHESTSKTGSSEVKLTGKSFYLQTWLHRLSAMRFFLNCDTWCCHNDIIKI